MLSASRTWVSPARRCSRSSQLVCLLLKAGCSWQHHLKGSPVMRGSCPSPPGALLSSLNNQGTHSSPDTHQHPWSDACELLPLLPCALQLLHSAGKKATALRRKAPSSQKSAAASENLPTPAPFLQLPSQHRLTGGTHLRQLWLLPWSRQQLWGRAGQRAASNPAKPRAQL